MLHRRISQFLIIYFTGITFLLSIKYVLNLSDYVIPCPADIGTTFLQVFPMYSSDVMDTLSVAVISQVLSICLAFLVGIIGRRTTWFGSFVKVAAYNIQAYPIVALPTMTVVSLFMFS
jgi:NitT/TauT family transport system permease protein